MTNIEIKKINESFFTVKNLPNNILTIITENLSVYAEGYQFNPAFRMGQWDGKVRFYKIKDGILAIPFGFLYVVESFLRKNKLNFTKVNFENKFNFNENDFNKFYKEVVKLPFEPYDYQLQAAKTILSEKRKIIQAATGAGKSYIMYLVIRYLHHLGKKSLIIVPNIPLTLQLQSDFEDYGWNTVKDDVKLIGGDFNNKDLNTHKTIISTWQSLARINEEEFKKIDCIITDECHLAKADVLNNILTKSENSFIRVGLTGTVPRLKEDKLKLISVFGAVKKVISPQGLIERGLATPVEIKLLYFLHKKRKFRKYQDEIKYLDESEIRTKKISQIVNKISEKENSLVLFNTVDFGKNIFLNLIKLKLKSNSVKILEKSSKKDIDDLIQNNIENAVVISNEDKTKLKMKLIKENYSCNVYSTFDLGIYLVYGGIKSSVREQIRNIIENEKGSIIVGSFKTMSTGINIKNLHNIFITSTTKSFFTIMQGIGRGMRLHKSKSRIRIWDIIDVIDEDKENYALRHSQERIEIYYDCEYPIAEKEISLH